jgi:hypothetical protein
MTPQERFLVETAINLAVKAALSAIPPKTSPSPTQPEQRVRAESRLRAHAEPRAFPRKDNPHVR